MIISPSAEVGHCTRHKQYLTMSTSRLTREVKISNSFGAEQSFYLLLIQAVALGHLVWQSEVQVSLALKTNMTWIAVKLQ